MMVGRADPVALGRGRPQVAALPRETLVLEGVTVLQAMFEMPRSAREAVLPPGLHPTNPAALVLQAWACERSPWGPFRLVQTRAQCRSGARPRGFVTGAVCDAEAAGAALAEELGFPIRRGRVELSRGYDAILLRVAVDEAPTLELEAVDPEPLAPGDVQYSSSLTLAHLPRGLRLIQIEPEARLERAERLRPHLAHFDGAAWGDPRLDPYHPVSASIADGRLEIPPVRYVCRPDVLAFVGTEPIEA